MSILTTGSLVTLTAFKLSSNQALVGVVSTATYPAGTAYDSHTSTGGGTFNGTSWVVDVPISTTTSGFVTLTVTVEVTDIDAFAAGTRILELDTTPAAGETNTANNHQERAITGDACPDFFSCFELFAVQIPAYDSMEDAFADLGADAWFKYTPDNIDGATTGSVHITEDLDAS